MNDKPKPEQAQVPGEAAVEAQKTTNQGRHYSGGDPLLDAQIAAGDRVASDVVDDQPVATGLAGNTETEDPADAENFTTTGAYPVDATRLEKNYDTPSIRAER